MRYFYDFLIFGFLLSSGALIIAAAFHFKKTGKKSAMIFFLTALSIFWAVVFYGSFIEPRRLAVRTRQIDLSAEGNGVLRAALLADFHVGPYKKEAYVKKVVSRVMSLNPDIVLIPGDFIFDDAEQVKYLSPLKDLHAPLGVFAVLGNHDYGSTTGPFGLKGEERAKIIKEALENFGIKVLVNEGLNLNKDGKTFALLGTDELWTGRANIEKALDMTGRPNILMSHNPDLVLKAQDFGIDLVLSAHTHAGQIRLPFIGPIPPLPDRLGRTYDRGLFRFKQTQLFITSGVGEMGPRARLFNPPEINLLEIKI